MKKSSLLNDLLMLCDEVISAGDRASVGRSVSQAQAHLLASRILSHVVGTLIPDFERESTVMLTTALFRCVRQASRCNVRHADSLVTLSSVASGIREMLISTGNREKCAKKLEELRFCGDNSSSDVDSLFLVRDIDALVSSAWLFVAQNV